MVRKKEAKKEVEPVEKPAETEKEKNNKEE
jgi:hypothetical protein